jgi:hypothetical protein
MGTLSVYSHLFTKIDTRAADAIKTVIPTRPPDDWNAWVQKP